jgi:hypothetical protein
MLAFITPPVRRALASVTFYYPSAAAPHRLVSGARTWAPACAADAHALNNSAIIVMSDAARALAVLNVGERHVTADAVPARRGSERAEKGG